MKVNNRFRKINLKIAVFAVFVGLNQIIQSPMAFAETKTFDCPGGGKYSVTDGVIKDNYDTQCIGNIVIDSSVTTLAYVGFYSKATSITIPATTLKIEAQPFISSELLSINVDSANPNFKSVDGVLYSKDGTNLILYPTNKSGESFLVPVGVTKISSYAFGCLNNLKTLVLPNSVSDVESLGALNGCSGSDNSLEAYTVGSENNFLSTTEGVLFNKDATLQIAYPRSKPGSNYKMLDSVTEVKSTSFGNSRFLKTINLSKNLEIIGYYAFDGLNLPTLHIPASVKVVQDLGLDSTKAVTLDPLNTNFVLIDGNLFSADKTKLVSYFNDDSRSTFIVPATVTTFGGYIFGNNDARSLIRLTVNNSLVEVGVLAGGPIKFLNLGNDFTFPNQFENWYFNDLAKVNYCGNNEKTIEVIKAMLVSSWTKASLVCVKTLPTFSLSRQSEEVEINQMLKAYTISQSDSIDLYSISPEPSQYGLSFDPLTGILSGTATVTTTLPVVFTIKGTNAIGDVTSTYSLKVNDVPVIVPPVVVEPTPAVDPLAEKSSYFVSTSSTKNLTRVSVTKATTAVKITQGKSLQFKIASVGKKAAQVTVSVTDPSGKSYKVESKAIAKTKSYTSPILQFIKGGNYVITTYVGSTKKVITVRVGK